MLKKLSTLQIFAFLLLSEPLRAIAQQTQPPTTLPPPQVYHPYGFWQMWNDIHGWPHWWLSPLLIMVTLVVICITEMIAVMRGRMIHGHRGDLVLVILKERDARGEIDQAKYEARKHVLKT